MLSKQITVYPVIDLSFDLKRPTPINGYHLPAEKYSTATTLHGPLRKTEKPFSRRHSMAAWNEGGTFVFKNKGIYTLTASITDDTADFYTYKAQGYPVAGIEFTLPTTSHTDKIVEVTPTLTEAEGLTVMEPDQER